MHIEGGLMKSAFVVAIYAYACIALGIATIRVASKISNSKEWSAYDVPIAAFFIIGQSLLVVAWTSLGLGGVLHTWLIWLVLLAASMSGGLQPLSLFKTGLSKLRSSITSVAGQPLWLRLFTLGIVALVLWYAILAWFRPPSGDAEAFYMTYAKLIAGTGEISLMPTYRDFSANGLYGELHFAALLAIGALGAAKLFAWETGIAAAFVLVAITRQVKGGGLAQLIAFAMTLTSTTFSDYLSDGKVDLFAAALGLTAVWWVISQHADALRENRLRLAVAGLLTGFALVAKFPYLVAFLPAIVLLIVWREFAAGASGKVDRKSFIRAISTLAYFGVWVAVATLPHLVKNGLLFGQPLAPFVGMNWTEQTWFSPENTKWILMTYPLALTFGLYPMQGGNLSFLLLASLPMIFLLPKPVHYLKSKLVQLTVSGLVGLLCWMLIRPSTLAPRYILATLLMLMPIGAIAFEYLWQHECKPRMASIAFAAALLLSVGAAPIIGIYPFRVTAYMMAGQPECGLTDTSYCRGLNAINAHAEPGERVLLLGYYSYWLRPDLLQCTVNVNGSPDQVELDF
jgi:hypothetical protein